MITITYYHVEQFVRPETGWERVKAFGMYGLGQERNGGYQDRADAEKLLEEEKAHWLKFLDGAEQTEETKKLRDAADWRIVAEEVTFTHASHYMHSDVVAYEIVRIVSDQTIEVREMKTKHSAANLEYTPGGFCGHFHNQDKQEVTYESDPEGDTIKIRRKKGKPEHWTYKGMRFGVRTAPYAFHDFNF